VFYEKLKQIQDYAAVVSSLLASTGTCWWVKTVKILGRASRMQFQGQYLQIPTYMG